MTSNYNNFTLLRTKLHRPPVSNDFVLRAELKAGLEKEMHLPFTLVSAGAGYGKTTLISSWIENCECASAWLNLDEMDNDPGLFLLYFFSAIQTRFPEVGKSSVNLLNTGDLPPGDVLARSVLNELDLIEEDFILVLDDYHFIHELRIHDLISKILKYPPRHVHLVVVTRSDPPFPIAKMRAKNLVNEIRMSDLRFSNSETKTFLKKLLSSELDDQTISLLMDKTEGWVTALRLIALSQKELIDTEQFVLENPSNTQYTIEYLVAEVLSNLEDNVKEFVLKTSILRQMSAPLCDHLLFDNLQESKGQEMLDLIYNKNLFVVPRDAEYQWFRYHDLFKQFLQQQLKKEYDRTSIVTLNMRASEWYLENGNIEEALVHCVEAKNIKSAVEIIAEHRHDPVNNENWYIIRRWFNLLPPGTVEKEPQLLILKAWLYIGWFEMFEILTKLNEHLKKLSPDSKIYIILKSEIEVIQSLVHYMRGDGEKSIESAKFAIKNLPDIHANEKSLAIILLSMAMQMKGKLQAARNLVCDFYKDKEKYHPCYQSRVILALCFVDSIAGDLDASIDSGKLVLKLGEKFKIPESTAHGYYFLGLSAYERNDLTSAYSYLQKVTDNKIIVNSFNYAHCSLLMAYIYISQGEMVKARDIIDAIKNHAVEVQNNSLLQMSESYLAEIAIREGNIAEVEDWARNFDPNPFYAAFRFYIPQITYAKRYLLKSTPESLGKASDLLTKLYDFYKSIHNTRLIIEILAIQALVYSAQHDEQLALEKLHKAIKLSVPGGHIRIFVDLGSDMAKLLSLLRNQEEYAQHIDKIIAAFETSKNKQTRVISTNQIIQTEKSVIRNDQQILSNREVDILSLLANRLSNKEIAENLSISPETVKKHALNIYQKLHVNSRREAVEKARLSGML
jgi:LuxR family maltose regulon positive regulatory protein